MNSLRGQWKCSGTVRLKPFSLTWSRKKGHSVVDDKVTDIINAKPDYLIIGSGNFGLMKVSNELSEFLSDCGVEVIVERSKSAMKIYNKMYIDGKNVAAAFHLSC